MRPSDMKHAFAAVIFGIFACTAILPTAVSAQLLPPLPGGLVVTVTSPASGSTVSGAVTVRASISPVGVLVAGVQFKLDGVNLGAEDTQSPYTISWNTLTAGNGSHTLTAVARDALGLRFTSSPVTVTVANDTTPPAVTMTSPAPGSTVAGTITVSAAASDNVGVAGVQFKLDGVDLAAEDTAAPFSISWDTTGATDTTHSLVAVARDAAGNVNTSAPVSFTVSNAPASTVTRVEDTDTAVAYSGVWFHGDASRAWSGGTTSFARGPGARASFMFTGTRIGWVSWRSPQAGIARVTLDGVLVAEINLFSSTEAVQETVFTSDVLPAGAHTLVIEATGTAGASATDTIVAVDAFDVTSSNVPPPPPPAETITRFEETSHAIVYSTGWNPGENSRPWSGGTATYTATVGAKATFTFTGKAVSWLGYRGPFGGIVRVFLDGALLGEVDTFAAVEQVPAVVFTAPKLAVGNHTLVIELTDKKNPSAVSTEMAVDAFDVSN